MTSAIAFLIIFWLPPAIVILHDFLWDLRLWHTREYSLYRVYTYLRWDFEPRHRKLYKTLIKIVLFILASTFLINPTSLVPQLSVLVAFALWASEVFNIVEKILNQEFPRFKFTMRNLSSIFVMMTILVAIPTFLALPIVDNTSEQNEATQLNSYQENNIFPQTLEATGPLIPDVYIFLIFATLIGITLDLGSPFFSAVIVVLTSPISWGYKQLLKIKLRHLLKYHKDLFVIVIGGSQGKTTVKQILYELLKNKYNVLTTPGNYTNIETVGHTLLDELQPNTEIVIFDLNAYKDNQIAEICEILKPNISILTGIDTSHLGLFGSIEKTLEVKSEVFQHLRDGGKAIINADNELALKAATKNEQQNITYHIDQTVEDAHLLPNLTNTYQLIDHNLQNQRLHLSLKTKDKELKITIDPDAKFMLHSLLAAVAAAAETGLDLSDIQHKLADIDLQLPKLSPTPGDNQSILFINNSAPKLKSLQTNLEQLKETKANDRYLITTGIQELAATKHSTYTKLAEQIQDSVDVLITFDKHLANAVAEENKNVDIVLVQSNKQLLYEVRRRLEPKDVLLLAGELDAFIIQQLRSEIS